MLNVDMDPNIALNRLFVFFLIIIGMKGEGETNQSHLSAPVEATQNLLNSNWHEC